MGPWASKTSQVPIPMGLLLYILNQEASSSREGKIYLLLWLSLIFISLEAGCRNKEIKGARPQLAQGLRSLLKQLQGALLTVIEIF